MNPIITAFAKGMSKAEIKPDRVSIVSDIPFEPATVRELGVDFFHSNRGRAIAFGTGLKLSNPSLRVVPFIGDLMTLGGNHFVHGGRRNMDLTVICVNNFVYRKLGGVCAPASPKSFSPFATFEEPFNTPHLANSCGAVFTARWTALHTKELADTIGEALKKEGYSVIEVLFPGPTFYTSIGSFESDLLNFYFENSVVKNGEDPRKVGITPDEKIVVGKFTEKEQKTYIETYNAQLSKVLGDKFTPYGI